MHLTPDELQRVLLFAKRIRLQHPVFGSIRFEWRATFSGELEMCITSKAPNRDQLSSISENEQRYQRMSLAEASAQSFAVYREQAMAMPRIRPPEIIDVQTSAIVYLRREQLNNERELLYYLQTWARDQLHKMAMHEVDEQHLIDNERTYDPHKNERSR